MKIITLIAGATAVSLLAGCSTTPMVSGRVGPAPGRNAGANLAGEGSLIVNSATLTIEDGDNSFYHPHTGYRIYTEPGKFWKSVLNHVNNTDEMAEEVELPSGNYAVHANSDFGAVVVPVEIVAGQTTVVNLDTAGEHYSPNTNNMSVVWLPTGPSSAYYPIGLRAE